MSVVWRVGLVNHQGKYLTQETFGFKINASGASMRNKQIWNIVQDQTEDSVVYLRSHLHRYLGTDKAGNVSCDSEETGQGHRFKVTYHTDGSGRWSFQSMLNSCYLSATEDCVNCKDMSVANAHWFNIRLDLHPQVNLRNVNRKKYAGLSMPSGELHCVKVVAWGAESLVSLQYINGKYAIRASDDRYLSSGGALVEESQPISNPDIQFTLEMHSAQYTGVALKDSQGKYLTAVGQNAVLQTRNCTVTKDELFTVEPGNPQVTVTAHNGKKVSNKQGIDLTANQEEVTEQETYQMEHDAHTNQWRLRTTDHKVWTVANNGGVVTGSDESSPNTLFTIDWLPDGHVTIKSTNGKYVTARMNGSLFATSENVTDKEKYHVTLINRPVLVLKCDYGLIGYKSGSNPRIECNKVGGDSMLLTYTEGAVYHIKGRSSGKYWRITDDGMINADSDSQHPFYIQLCAGSKMAVKAENGKFLKAEQNGIVCAKGESVEQATLWEY